jgi:excisionase family DNA binding protein
MTERHEISAREAARHLSVDKATVIRWIRAGKLAGWQTPGGHWRIPRTEIECIRSAGKGQPAD